MFESILKSYFFKRFISLVVDMALAVGIGVLLELVFSEAFGIHLKELPFLISVALILIKDSYQRTGSIGKNLVGLQLVDLKGNNLSLVKRLYRNITLLLLPVEVIIAILFKGRRIGDFWAQSIVEPR